jgi:perosamine synthetase
VSAERVDFPWPVLTHGLERALLDQARSALSIYDRSGVVAAFEDAFSSYVGVPHALATSSGTCALHSIYYGLHLRQGDEVIVSDYGFFATATPLLPLEAHPVFVECEPDGTIAVSSVCEAISSRTRAVVATHMWGMPGRVDELQKLCMDHGLALVEDCSHAHGARLGGRVVGSFGQAAAWSLQAEKTLWAGEGGVLTTKLTDVFERALLIGHFNQRALRDITPESPNHEFAFTGTGLKFRAHPLGLALALAQLPSLDQTIQARQATADQLIGALERIRGIRILSRSYPSRLHSYYGLIALIDPTKCGFTREDFVDILRAEGIYCVRIPKQMSSLSMYPVFAGRCTSKVNANSWSRRIGPWSVCFFVPALLASDRDRQNFEFVIEAVQKVGRFFAGT